MTVKLVIIEGLPGAGKSTISSLVDDILKEMKIEAKLFLEGDLDHPADYESVALFRPEDFAVLIADYPEYQKEIEGFARETAGNYYITYGKLRHELGADIPGDLLKILASRDIYELPLSEHIDQVVRRWNKFAGKAIEQDRVIVFECCFIQNPITVTMIRDNAPLEVSLNYINQLAEAVDNLEPILIYLDQPDIEYSFKRVFAERPKEWLNFFVDYYTKQGYGLENNLHGIEGTIRILEERKRREMEIYQSLKMTKHLLDNSHFNYAEARSKLREILSEIWV